MEDTRSITRKIIGRSKDFTQQELERGSHWAKTLAALNVGMVAGSAPVLGVTTFFGFVMVMFACSYFTYSILMRADVDADGHFELHKEGWSSAIPLFTLTWIVTFTMTYS